MGHLAGAPVPLVQVGIAEESSLWPGPAARNHLAQRGAKQARSFC